MTTKTLKPKRGSALTQDVEGKGTIIVTGPRFKSYHDRTPVLVVPLNPKSVEAIRHKMAEAFNGSYDGHIHKDDLTAMLRAIGVPAKCLR